MFSKVLVANRGEIAARVMRTCRDMGIGTVAVYSDADRDSLHVRLADEARRIGPPPSSESYLVTNRILEAAKETGAEAIHPGYGFLAENADFARACSDEGLVFIGPSPEAMALMGDKARARAVASKASVPTVPGTAPLDDEREALEEARRLGFPVLVKATAGGGGKGMRAVGSPKELPSAFRQARSEAESSFGDPSVYLEKQVVNPRHIEFQVIADDTQALHLWERECSVQRRHQKLIEEAPSPFVTPELRERMGAAATRLVREASYRNAGTVEFLVDQSSEFYFLEMNARLQVEHPITELVTGVDLVRLQLLVAAGERIPFRQEDVKARGWAIELRITAEDPFQNFLPSAGVIRFLRPAEGPGVRHDSGVYSGAEVTPHYDPLIAKLVVGGDDREHCVARALRAVREYQVNGIPTTLPFFERMLSDERFRAGEIDVGFVDRHWMSEIANRVAPDKDAQVEAALSAAAAFSEKRRQSSAAAQSASRSHSHSSAWKLVARREQSGGRL
jgi:acetyl-CoA carboxylase biotin carboxylase subunit